MKPTQPQEAPAPSFFSEPAGTPAAQGQLALDLEDVEMVMASRGVYTAESFQRREPQRYAMLCAGLAAGYPLERLRKHFGVSWELVRAIQRKEAPDKIREFRGRLVDKLDEIVLLALGGEDGESGLVAKARDGKLSAFDTKLLAELAMTMRGEATQITETREDPAAAAWRDFMARMGSERGGISQMREAAGRVVDMPESGDKNAGDALASGAVPLGQEGAHFEAINPDTAGDSALDATTREPGRGGEGGRS